MKGINLICVVFSVAFYPSAQTVNIRGRVLDRAGLVRDLP